MNKHIHSISIAAIELIQSLWEYHFESGGRMPEEQSEMKLEIIFRYTEIGNMIREYLRNN